MKRRFMDEGKKNDLPMAPMIDVVFLLLVFFILTIAPMDYISHLEVFSPRTDPSPSLKPPPPVLQIAVHETGFSLNRKVVSFEGLEQLLGKLAGLDNRQSVLVICSPQSSHDQLVRVLDLCNRLEMKNLSVMTGKG